MGQVNAGQYFFLNNQHSIWTSPFATGNGRPHEKGKFTSRGRHSNKASLFAGPRSRGVSSRSNQARLWFVSRHFIQDSVIAGLNRGSNKKMVPQRSESTIRSCTIIPLSWRNPMIKPAYLNYAPIRTKKCYIVTCTAPPLMSKFHSRELRGFCIHSDVSRRGNDQK